ncbi:MAG: hypothetical protein QME41_03190 [Actinomycetota bacterium]|nr:hypothetical protein [Actinomycetota bacterium]
MNEDILKYIATKHDLEELGIVLRDEFRQSQSEVLSRLDKIVTMVMRHDQERLFTFEYVKRVEGEVEKIETKVEKSRKDIEHIKDILKTS